MSLTLGGGPLATRVAGDANYAIDGPPHRLYLHEWGPRVRAVVAGEVVVDTTRARLLHESNLHVVAYVPNEDVRGDLLEPTETSTHCPFKGDAAYWSIRVGDDVRVDAVWGYDDPIDGAPPLAGLRAVVFGAVDAWYVEDEEVVGGFRDPFHRVDVLASSRQVVVRAGDVELARTAAPLIVTETGLRPRPYIPIGDIDTSTLTGSATTTTCPYKGVATYHHIDVDGQRLDDAAWAYPDGTGDCARLADHVAFDDRHVTVEVAASGTGASSLLGDDPQRP